ncbi:MAG: TIGR04283 family arsenosugar biosynthesis glycosyltransferase [Desulfosarcina sp.]
MAANPIKKNHLIVFGRYPALGRVKTRLIPALGPAGAAALQKRLVEQTIAQARRSAAQIDARLSFCHDGGTRSQIIHWLNIGDIDCMPQTSGDLGRRMFLSIRNAFRRGAERTVLIGTDIPDLKANILDQAFDQLKRNDLVLGPSTDGGYWLVGMSKPENIFDGIAWSTSTVLEKTLALARRKAMRIGLLEPLADLDTPNDLARWSGGKISTAPYLSVIIPTLNEAARIADTLSGAASPDTEIIVSDGGSCDQTVDIARSCGARIVAGRRGRAGQQNRGAAAAGGDVLIFLHADTRLPPHFVGHIFETLMDRQVVLGAFRFQTDIPGPAMRWVTFWTNLRAKWLQLPYGDQGLFMQRPNFLAVGGFPDVPIAEDLYLVRRMAPTGRITLAPAATVTSGRRWQRLGLLRTTMINTAIAIGCLAGVAPQRLAQLYRLPLK